MCSPYCGNTMTTSSSMTIFFLFHISEVGLEYKIEEAGGTSNTCLSYPDELDNVEDEEWICFLGNNSSGTKKYQGSNSSDGVNHRDEVKIAGGVIGSGGGIDDSLA
ncbi:hypothetical protein Tco_1005648 [Tanacetum coccineum]|uniref:Uncharacterized protein n=1 Tax=Tanacetum coccineum TaxID=301880 RepID=A0ABQ5FGM7_9ASTR